MMLGCIWAGASRDPEVFEARIISFGIDSCQKMNRNLGGLLLVAVSRRAWGWPGQAGMLDGG